MPGNSSPRYFFNLKETDGLSPVFYLDIRKVKSAVPGVLSCRQPRVPARRNGHKDARGTRRHLSNNNDNGGAELLRKEGGAPNTGISLSLQPPVLTSPLADSRALSSSHKRVPPTLTRFSIFKKVPRLFKDSRSRRFKKKINLEPQS